MHGAASGKNGWITRPGTTKRWRRASRDRKLLVEALRRKAEEATARASDPTLPRATRARYEGMANGIIAALEMFDSADEELAESDGRRHPSPA